MKSEIFLGSFLSLTAVAILSPALAANPTSSGSAGKNPAVTLQPIPGSPAKRVILTAKAAERLGIETGKVGEQPLVRKQMVAGIVIPPMGREPESKPGGGKFGGFAQAAPAPGSKTASSEPAASTRAAPALLMAGDGFGGFGRGAPAPQTTLASAAPATSNPMTAKDAPPVAAPTAPPIPKEAWLLVTVSQAEWDRLAKDKPARVLPLATRGKLANEISAKPSGMQPQEDSKRSMLKLYYVVTAKDHGLEFNKRMRVELQLEGSDETHKVVPYSAVHYDAKGAPWVYVNTQPLTYERQRVTVERVVGEVAVLSDGPAIGTPVVVTGAPLLYGTEVFGK
jgi:hypothetical protein